MSLEKLGATPPTPFGRGNFTKRHPGPPVWLCGLDVVWCTERPPARFPVRAQCPGGPAQHVGLALPACVGCASGGRSLRRRTASRFQGGPLWAPGASRQVADRSGCLLTSPAASSRGQQADGALFAADGVSPENHGLGSPATCLGIPTRWVSGRPDSV